MKPGTVTIAGRPGPRHSQPEETEAVSEYVVIYERSDTGWGAYCPDLPGLGVVGDTRHKVDRLIREGIVVHIESLREHGEPVPDPVTTAGTVEVSAV